MGAGPLLLTKLEAPHVRPGHVRRGDLVARLDAGLRRRLDIVVAPAGWGKTTLLAEWLARDDGPSFAWVSLDEGDNDPARFWSHVAASLRKAGVELPEAFEAAAAAPGTTAADAALPLLINTLAQAELAPVLVLDDYHLITQQEIHGAMRLLVERLPMSAHVVISSRTEPPLGIARLRARGDLGEIASDQLQFSEAEAAALFNETLELSLPAEQLELLSARTEGWVAGLYLAGLSLRDRAGSGYDRHLDDYLGEEVLAVQAPRVRDFLVDTCVLDRFCAPLCDAVRGDDASRALLAEIERANLFLVPIDADWFRYHHVFRDVLRRAMVETRSAEHISELHARAGAWFAGEGDVSAALPHLLAAGHGADAADLVARSWNESLQSGRAGTVGRWLDALGDQITRTDPRLAVARAWLAFDEGEAAAALRWADAALAADDGRPLEVGGASVPSSVAMLRATLALRAGDLPIAEELGAQAVDLESDPHSPWRAVALATLGAARHFRGGSSAEVTPLLEQAVAIAQEGANSLAVLRALGTLAAAALDAGDADAAARWAGAADALSAQQSLDEYWMGSLAQAVAGRLAAERGELQEAQQRLERAVVLADRGSARPERIYALAALAPVQATLGEHEEAVATLRRARAALRDAPSPGTLPLMLDDVERRLRGRPQSTLRSAGAEAEELTAREMSVLRMLASELSLAEIGDALYVSRNTVRTHVRGIYRKLDADTRASALSRARELGLL